MWEETVLRKEKIEAIIRRTFPLFELDEEGEEDRKATAKELLEAQAQITGDIAYKKGVDDANFEWRAKKVPKVMKQFEKAGARKVVEFVDEHLPQTLANYVGFWHQWQAYLKSLEGEKEWKKPPCPLCNDSGKVLITTERTIGYTLAQGETTENTLDEHYEDCPLCKEE